MWKECTNPRVLNYTELCLCAVQKAWLASYLQNGSRRHVGGHACEDGMRIPKQGKKTWRFRGQMPTEKPPARGIESRVI